MTESETEPWEKSLETGFLIGCPNCCYLFPDTLRISAEVNSGELICKRCNAGFRWSKEVTIKFTTRAVSTTPVTGEPDTAPTIVSPQPTTTGFPFVKP